MSDDNNGPSSAELHASGAMKPNVGAGAGIGNNGSGGGGLMPVGDKGIDFSIGGIDLKLTNIDSDLFGGLNAGGGALGGDPASAFSATFNQLGTKEMDETATLKIDNLGPQEVGQLNPIADLNGVSYASFKSGGARGE
jgi:hypothetical protein